MTEVTAAGGVHAAVLGVFTLASCVWVGGYVAIAVVARTAARTLDPPHRVAFFRSLGRSYLRVGGTALVVALGTGAALAAQHGGDDGLRAASGAIALALVGALAVGVAQARRMTRLRSAALGAPDGALADRVRQGTRSATALRAAIGLLSLTLIVLGSLLAS